MTSANTVNNAEGVQAKFKESLVWLDKELSQYKCCNELERQTGVPKTYFALGGGGLIAIMIFFNYFGKLLSNVISWVYPAYASFKAIESPQTNDDKQWLTYWTVVGFVQMVEYFSDIFLFWFPFYFFFKTAFVMWLALPQFKGAEFLYSRFLRSFLLQAQGDIDKSAHDIKQKASDLLSDKKE